MKRKGDLTAVKCLSYKQEELSSIPNTHVKAGHGGAHL